MIKGTKPLAVLIRAMHYYEDQANGYMGLIASLKKPPEPPTEDVEGHKKWEENAEALDKKVIEAAGNLKDAFDAAADYAFKAAGFVHPRPSPDHGAQFDYTRLSADELRIFIPLFKKCLVGRTAREDSERAAKVTPDLLPEVMEKHLQQLSTSEQNWWPAWRHRDAVSVTYERPFLPTLHRHPMAGLRHPPRVLLREQGKGRGGCMLRIGGQF